MQIEECLHSSVDENIALFKRIFPSDSTIKFRRYQHSQVKSLCGCLIYIEGMVSTETLDIENIFTIMDHGWLPFWEGVFSAFSFPLAE